MEGWTATIRDGEKMLLSLDKGAQRPLDKEGLLTLDKKSGCHWL